MRAGLGRTGKMERASVMSDGPNQSVSQVVYRVGDCEVQPDLNTIKRAGRSMRCEPRVIDVLLCLIRHAPAPVSKEQIREEVWRSTGRSTSWPWTIC